MKLPDEAYQEFDQLLKKYGAYFEGDTLYIEADKFLDFYRAVIEMEEDSDD